MNIIMIPSWFETKDKPTLGSFFLNQAKALQANGHKVFILYYDLFSAKTIRQYMSYTENEVSERDGVTIYRKRVFAPFKHGEICACNEAAANAVLYLFKKYLKGNVNIDIIHAQSCIWAGYAAKKLSNEINVPYVITEHSTMYHLRPYMIKRVRRDVVDSFHNASRVIAVSEALGKTLRYITRVDEIIPNVIETDRFIMAPQKNCNNEFTFLSVAYLHDIDKKGLPLLLVAFSELIKRVNVPVCLKIGGDGDKKYELVELCQKLGIKQSVIFLGSLSREQVVSEMQKCDAFVLPSRYETFGVVYFEAMATGKPVIATATGGPDSYITPNTGILIDTDNKEALIYAMQEIIENYNHYSDVNIREHVVDNFSPKIIATKLTAVYKSVIQR